MDPTRAFNLLACALTYGYKLITRGFELVTRGLELVTRAFDLLLVDLNS